QLFEHSQNGRAVNRATFTRHYPLLFRDGRKVNATRNVSQSNIQNLLAANRPQLAHISATNPPIPRIEQQTHIVSLNVVDQQHHRIDLVDELETPVSPLCRSSQEVQSQLHVASRERVSQFAQPPNMKLKVLMKRPLLARRPACRKARSAPSVWHTSKSNGSCDKSD